LFLTQNGALHALMNLKKIMAGEIYTGTQRVTSNQPLNLAAFVKCVHEAAEVVPPSKRRGLAVGRFAVGLAGEGTSRSWVFIICGVARSPEQFDQCGNEPWVNLKKSLSGHTRQGL
jgi:hypothetical protein